MPQEFSPKYQIMQSLRLWWILVLTIFAGGIIGYSITRIQPPVYQAKATLYTFINFQDIRDVQLSTYDEDLIINSIESLMLSNDVIGPVLTQAAAENISIDYKSFMRQKSAYRKLSDFELYFRDNDPEIAQKIANIWLEATIQVFNQMQRDGYLPLYLLVNVGRLADLPVTPTYSQTNSFVLSGAVFGSLIGLILTSNPYLIAHFNNKHPIKKKTKVD